MIDLTLVVVGADRGSLESFDQTHIDVAELVLIANGRGESLASIGNRYLEASRCAIFGLVHADCSFHSGDLELFSKAALSSVCGIVGITEQDLYRWDFQKPGPVQTLDSCSVFFRKDSGLKFDPVTFDGFHCHVQDLCMQAHKQKIPVIVPAANARHQGINFAQPTWRADYGLYIQRLHKKWGGTIHLT